MRPVPGRYVHTGLTPNPIDTWALAQWNAGIEQARDAYERRMLGRIPHPVCAMEDCTIKTGHNTGLCSLHRPRSTRPSYRPCEGPACTHKTIHPTGLCWDCRRVLSKQTRAMEWSPCIRPGCGKATRDMVCSACQSGATPTGPGNHWSNRYRTTP